MLVFIATSVLSLTPTLPASQQPAVAAASAAAAASRRGTRRDLLLAGGVAALGGLATPAHASYALYQSSYDTFQDRKATGYVPVATDDRASLAEIQKDIRRKRPASAMKPERTPQYCAGQTSAVTPMMENICSNIGVSKADQSNTMTDAFGNMNIGSYTSASGAERAAQEARLARVKEAAEAARLRQVAKKMNE